MTGGRGGGCVEIISARSAPSRPFPQERCSGAPIDHTRSGANFLLDRSNELYGSVSKTEMFC